MRIYWRENILPRLYQLEKITLVRSGQNACDFVRLLFSSFEFKNESKVNTLFIIDTLGFSNNNKNYVKMIKKCVGKESMESGIVRTVQNAYIMCNKQTELFRLYSCSIYGIERAIELKRNFLFVDDVVVGFFILFCYCCCCPIHFLLRKKFKRKAFLYIQLLLE